MSRVAEWRAFEVSVPGKWVLAGEHTVLRGGTALAIPHPEFRLSLRFAPGGSSLAVSPDLASLAIHDLLRVAVKNLGDFERPCGRLTIESTIPFGAGLGSSAALSVAVARWILTALGGGADEIALGRAFEDQFHGQSSGMDVSVVSIGRPIRFRMKGGAEPLSSARLPQFRFHDTGLRASTRDCIAQVDAFRVREPRRAQELDERMALASVRAEEGLALYPVDAVRGLELLAASMRESSEVFAAWGLIPGEAQRLLADLEHSSLAARLTGAGGGGFVVSLEA